MKKPSTFTLRDHKFIRHNDVTIGRVVPSGDNFVGIIGDFDDDGHCLRKWRQGPACDDAAIAFAEVVARHQGYKDAMTMAHANRAAPKSSQKSPPKKTATKIPAHQTMLMRYIDSGKIFLRRAA